MEQSEEQRKARLIEAESAANEYANQAMVTRTYLDHSIVRNAFLAGAIHGFNIAVEIHEEVTANALI